MSDAAEVYCPVPDAGRGRAPWGRRLAVLAAVAFAIGVPAWQMSAGFGLSAAEFSAQGDSTLRAAPWAFAVWGLIYLWLIVYGIYQLFAGRETPRLHTLGWPSALAIAGCGAWIIASALNTQWATVGIIVVSAMLLTGELASANHQPGTRREAFFVTWPLALLAGWLTVASALNLLTVLTAQNLVGAGQAEFYGLTGIAAVAIGAAVIQRVIGPPTYGLAVAWGLVGVAAAEMSSGVSLLALAAGAGAVLTAISALWPRR